MGSAGFRSTSVYNPSALLPGDGRGGRENWLETGKLLEQFGWSKQHSSHNRRACLSSKAESRASFRELPSDLTGALRHTQARLLHIYIKNQPTTTQNKQIPNPTSKPKSAELDEKLSKERKQLNEKNQLLLGGGGACL